MSEYDTGWTTTKDWGKKTTSRGILTREKENDRDRERERWASRENHQTNASKYLIYKRLLRTIGFKHNRRESEF